MSSRRLRTYLLFLLMLVLPVQVMAGAIMPLCTTAQAQVEQVMAQDHAHDHHAATSSAHDNSEHSGQHGSDSSHAGCSLCASSCHTYGPLSSLGLQIPFSPHAELAFRDYQSFDGHIGDIPRRPPRQVTL